MESTKICGLTIRYRIVTAKTKTDNPPLLVCNGLAQSIETVQAFAERFTDRNVILFDAPGVGRSQVPVVPLTMKKYGDVVEGLLDAIGCGTVDLIGISWGGVLAQQLARAHPNRYRKLILALTAAGGLTIIPGRLGLIFEMMFPTRYLSASRRKKMVPKLAGGDAVFDPSLVLNVYERNEIPRFWGYYSQIISIRFWTSLHWLHELKQPTLVLSGTEDPLVPPINQKILAKRIPKAELRSYDCGHYLVTTRQDVVVPDIREFLDRK